MPNFPNKKLLKLQIYEVYIILLLSKSREKYQILYDINLKSSTREIS